MTELMEAIRRSPYRYKWVNGEYYRTHKVTSAIEIFNGSWQGIKLLPSSPIRHQLELERAA